MRGANEKALRDAIEQYKKQSTGSFQGSGLSLGGPTTSSNKSSMDDIRAARLRALGGGGGNTNSSSSSSSSSSGNTKSSSSTAPRKIEPNNLNSLLNMGFTKVRATKALLATGVDDVESALTWLVEHQDDPTIDIDDTPSVPTATTSSMEDNANAMDSSSTGPLPTTKTTAPTDPASSSSSSTSAATTTTTASNTTENNTAPMTNEEMDEINAAEEAFAAEAVANGVAPPKKLTAEEVQAKLKTLRAAKAAKAKEDARLNEIKRREEGKKSTAMADDIAALQRKQEYEKQKILKEFDAKEKLRLQLELLKDKAERETKQHGRASEETMAKIKALQEGKPLASALPPREQIQKLIKAFSLQKVNGTGKSAAELLKKVMENITNNPTDPKFRMLKVSNKVIQEKIIQAEGGTKFLLTLGFVKDDSDSTVGTVYRLPDESINNDLLKEAIKDIDTALSNGSFN